MECLKGLSNEEISIEVRQQLRITYVGHSMGGMTLPMYIIQSNMKNKPHFINQAILMSPAGFHTLGRVTPYMHYIGIMFYHIIPALVDHIALPEFMIGLISKLQ